MDTEETHKSRQTRNAILLVVGGLSFAAFSGALMKLLSEDLSPVQITWFRFMGLTIFVLPVVVFRLGWGFLKPARPGLQVVRGLTMSAATVAFVTGARTIEYADAIAILYAYPFVLTLIAVFFLGESVQKFGWVGLIGGFLGVLLVMRPEFSRINTGALFVFLCAVIIAVQIAINRKLGSLSHPLVTTLWGSVVATLSLSLIVPYQWEVISTRNFWLLVVVAITGGVNQICLVHGFARAEASTLAPFTYFEIVAAVLFGLIVFGTLPDLFSWGGIGLIVISGMVVAHSLNTGYVVRKGTKY